MYLDENSESLIALHKARGIYLSKLRSACIITVVFFVFDIFMWCLAYPSDSGNFVLGCVAVVMLFVAIFIGTSVFNKIDVYQKNFMNVYINDFLIEVLANRLNILKSNIQYDYKENMFYEFGVTKSHHLRMYMGRVLDFCEVHSYKVGENPITYFNGTVFTFTVNDCDFEDISFIYKYPSDKNRNKNKVFFKEYHNWEQILHDAPGLEHLDFKEKYGVDRITLCNAELEKNFAIFANTRNIKVIPNNILYGIQELQNRFKLEDIYVHLLGNKVMVGIHGFWYLNFKIGKIANSKYLYEVTNSLVEQMLYFIKIFKL